MAEVPEIRDGFGPLEGEVMDAVWGAGEAVAVRQVVDQLNQGRAAPLAYTTVMTVMVRLAEKDVLSRRKEGRGFVYEATAPDAAGLAVKKVLDTYGAAAVAHFADEARADPEIMKRLRAILKADGQG
jgi:predicted transcriptional regulator